MALRQKSARRFSRSIVRVNKHLLAVSEGGLYFLHLYPWQMGGIGNFSWLLALECVLFMQSQGRPSYGVVCNVSSDIHSIPPWDITSDGDITHQLHQKHPTSATSISNNTCDREGGLFLSTVADVEKKYVGKGCVGAAVKLTN
jgi:hypothetical protein